MGNLIVILSSTMKIYYYCVFIKYNIIKHLTPKYIKSSKPTTIKIPTLIFEKI